MLPTPLVLHLVLLQAQTAPAPSAVEGREGTVGPWRFARGIVESTTDVWPQIQPSLERSPSLEVPFMPRRMPREEAPDLPDPVEALGPPPAGGVLSAFSGMEETRWRPPDPNLAVGPAHIVQTVNQNIAFYTKQGELLFTQPLNMSGDPGFFEEVGARQFTFDPKCFYDHYSGRFVVTAFERYAATTESYLDIAVSDDSDPNGTWFKYRTDAMTEVDGLAHWVDYPGLGFDPNAIYVTADLLDFTNTHFGGVKYRVFDKASLWSETGARFADLHQEGVRSVQVAHSFGSAPHTFMASISAVNRMRIQTIENPLEDPELDSFELHIPTFGVPYILRNLVPNLDGCGISALDGRLINVCWRDGSLYTAHGVLSGNKIVARWYQVATHNWPNTGVVRLLQVGDIDPGGEINTWFPAILANAQGDVGVVLARSSPEEYAGIWVTGRRASDPAGTMTLPLTPLAIGTSGYCDFRWGDFFGIALDPLDDRVFWGAGQVATAIDHWQTWIGSFSLEAPNTPPVFEAPSPCDMTLVTLMSQPITFTVTASDVDADDTLTLDATDVPAGAVHVPALPATGAPVSTTFSWTPTFGQSGDHTIIYTVSDGEASTKCSVQIRVRRNLPGD